MLKKAMAAFGLVTMLCSAGMIYPATMQVTDISGDVVTMATATGYTYQFYGAEDYMEGDIVSLVMWDTAADGCIVNDIILSHRYSGFSAEEVH